MTLPWYLWGAGARAVGLTHGADRVRCSECRRWTRTPAWYGPPNVGPAAVSETERILCTRHQEARVKTARLWVERNERTAA